MRYRNHRFFRILLGAVLLPMAIHAEELPFAKGTLHINVMTSNAVRMQYEESVLPKLPEYVYLPQQGRTHYTLKKKGQVVTLKTSDMHIIINGKRGNIVAYNRQGEQVVRFAPAITSTLGAQLSINNSPDEYLYGMGQFQDGYNNIRGLSRRLTQVNTQIAIPMFISSRGYGVLWNNYGLTLLNPLQQKAALTKVCGAEGVKETVEVTSTEGGKTEERIKNLFKGEISVTEDGDYSLLLDVGQKMARRHNLTIDGQIVMDAQNVWLPPTASAIVHLTKGKHRLEAELEKDDRPLLYYGKVTDRTVVSSPMPACVDFTLFTGSADEVVAAYRKVTGAAAMMPDWALGYIHCRERFHSQDEILQTANEFHRRQIPIDMIVQDWQWWGRYGWNSMHFDEHDYPAPARLVDSLHNMKIRLMLSVWSKIDPSSTLGKEMYSNGYYIPGTEWIDFFNPDAAASYWHHFRDSLVTPYHIDAFWLDATEPENDDLHGRRVNHGQWNGDMFRNVYPLLVNRTVCEGYRRDDPTHQHMILTRSGFPGIQRYDVAMWSGDVGNSWETLRRQITAGLGMAASGMPWWTYDAGGFFRPGNQYTDADYQERMLRWIETSVYLPLMRVHGYMSDTEPWRYSESTQRIFKKCIDERERLKPYLREANEAIAKNGYTLMRPLVFDFPSDEEALKQSTEYMFGPRLLVCPVYAPKVTAWRCYLPWNAKGWKEIHLGTTYEGGKYVDIPVDESYIPVFEKL